MAMSSSKVLLEAVEGIMFIVKSLKSMKISVKLPVMVKVDNAWGMFMVGKFTAIRHTKHMNTRLNYVNDYV